MAQRIIEHLFYYVKCHGAVTDDGETAAVA